MTPGILLSVVVIGRNEGARLVRCLESVRAMGSIGGAVETIYVDSGSTDGSPARAAELGATVLTVQPLRPCAAVGRNAGWRAARGEFVLFLDGDTVLDAAFPACALRELAEPQVGVVWGHRREIRAHDSIYNRVLDLDWIFPIGESTYCGGDAVMRREVLVRTDGFDDTLIAGEEPELCRRIRAAGWTIRHIDAPMTGHDLAIGSFRQYWRRAFRSGHAYAELAARFRGSADPLWLAESRRNLAHGAALIALPAAAALASVATASIAPVCVIVALLGAVVLRSAYRARAKSEQLLTRLAYAVHSHLQQVPIALGQLAFRLDRARGRRRGLIDYKAHAR